MHDSAALGVREPRQDALEEPDELRQRQVPHVRAQRPLREVLHRDVRRAVVLEEVVDGDDVRMAQRARHARLAHEALRHRGLARPGTRRAP